MKTYFCTKCGKPVFEAEFAAGIGTFINKKPYCHVCNPEKDAVPAPAEEPETETADTPVPEETMPEPAAAAEPEPEQDTEPEAEAEDTEEKETEEDPETAEDEAVEEEPEPEDDPEPEEDEEEEEEEEEDSETDELDESESEPPQKTAPAKPKAKPAAGASTRRRAAGGAGASSRRRAAGGAGASSRRKAARNEADADEMDDEFDEDYNKWDDTGYKVKLAMFAGTGLFILIALIAGVVKMVKGPPEKITITHQSKLSEMLQEARSEKMKGMGELNAGEFKKAEVTLEHARELYELVIEEAEKDLTQEKIDAGESYDYIHDEFSGLIMQLKTVHEMVIRQEGMDSGRYDE